MGQASERIEVADALRGVAVAGIILYHAVESFNAFYPDARFTLACDEDVFGIATLLLSGKMYGIFALLFGLTFHIMLSRSMSRWRFAWRMVLLFVIGMVNIAVYDGDILTSYALCGLLLILCSRLSNRWLWVLTVLVLAQPFELWQLLSGWTMPTDWIWSDYALLAQHHQESGFWQNVVMNVRYAFVANMGYFTFTGRLTQTFGLFLLGLLFGRTRMFCNEGQNLLVWKLILVAGCLAIGVWSMWSPLLSNQQPTPIIQYLSPIFNLAVLLTEISAIVLLWYASARLRKMLAPVCTFGRMSLSNYLLQSVIGCFLFYGYGLGLYCVLGRTYAILAGAGMVILQIVVTCLWARRHQRGPAESLWRKGTYMGTKTPSPTPLS